MGTKTKNYIDGAWLNSHKNEYGPMLFIELNDAALKQIHALPKNEKGSRQLIATPQKENKKKWSLYQNESTGAGKDEDPFA